MSQKSADSSKVRRGALEAYLQEMGIEPGTDAAKAARTKINAESPNVFATMDDVIAHIDQPPL